MKKLNKKIVCLGGGTGTSVVLSGLKKYPVNLTAIVTMFDSGASGGQLRKELDILPPGDIRRCLLALSNENTLANLFHYRFERGTLKGHNLGNLLIAGAVRVTGNLSEGIAKIVKILNIKGEVIPVTLEQADIVVVLKNNKKVKEEENIINCPAVSRRGVKKLLLEPKVKANPKAVAAIRKADLIIVTPGKFYTSVLPIFLVKGISQAVQESRAKKVFICNLMTQTGNTDGFSVGDFLTILEKYLGKNVVDYVIFNTGRLSANQLKKVRKTFPRADFIDYDRSLLNKNGFIGQDLIDRQIHKLNSVDILAKGANKRTMILHNPDKLAKIILNLCKQ